MSPNSLSRESPETVLQLKLAPQIPVQVGEVNRPLVIIDPQGKAEDPLLKTT